MPKYRTDTDKSDPQNHFFAIQRDPQVQKSEDTLKIWDKKSILNMEIKRIGLIHLQYICVDYSYLLYTNRRASREKKPNSH